MRRAEPTSPSDAPAPVRLWRDPTAWQVTAFFAAQALLAYVIFGWLPSMCQDRGISVAHSGLILSLTSLVGVMGAASMAQGIGFLLATVGPLGTGLLHEVSDGWGLPLAVLLAVCLAQVAAGLAAGRTRRGLQVRR